MQNKYPIMRRKDRSLPHEDTMLLLQNGEYGVLATSSASTGAYATPLSYVLHQNQIYFHSALQGHKIDALQNDARASFCVVGGTLVVPAKFTTCYESAIAFGTLCLVGDAAEKENALRLLCEKYSPLYMDDAEDTLRSSLGRTAIIRLDICHVTGKSNR